MRKPNNLPPLETVFWYGWDEVVRVERLGPCWEWSGPKHARGYGNIRTKTSDGRQTFVRAHRVMLASTGIEVPPHLHVLHSCDNPPCIRPEHLRTGTDADNTRDKMSRGRYRRGDPMPGESNPYSKLTLDAVRQIRQRYIRGGISQEKLGIEFGVSQSAIWKIVNELTWTE